jgi:hypothetical protein
MAEVAFQLRQMVTIVDGRVVYLGSTRPETPPRAPGSSASSHGFNQSGSIPLNNRMQTVEMNPTQEVLKAVSVLLEAPIEVLQQAGLQLLQTRNIRGIPILETSATIQTLSDTAMDELAAQLG